MCPIGFLMLGSPCKTCRAIRPPHADQPAPGGEPRCAPAPTNEPSSRAPGLSWSATRSSWPLPNHLPRRRPGPNRRLGWPSTACASFKTRRRLRQTTSRAWTQRATTPTPAIPAVRLPAPPPRSRTSLRPDTADAATHKHRTPTPDAHTGRRTADAGQRTPGRSDARTGHRSRGQASVDTGRSHRTPDTGHWTPDAGRGRGQADEGAAGIRTSWATTPSDRALGCPTVFLWTAPAALGSPCRLGGEAAFQREIASRRQLLGRSAGVERRLGALLSSDECRVERRANGDASSVMASGTGLEWPEGSSGLSYGGGGAGLAWRCDAELTGAGQLLMAVSLAG